MNYILLCLTALSLSGCAGYKYNEDNLAEESIELLIKSKTGVDLDLSASSKEEGFNPKVISPLSKERDL